MSDFITAAILGVVQGVTEFLPISSTGHLILVNQFFDFSDHTFSKLFDVVIQLGSILAVVIYFWNRLWPFGRRKPLDQKLQVWHTWFKAVVGIIPMLIIGAVGGSRLQDLLYGPKVVAVALLAWGIFLIIIEKRERTSTINSIATLSYSTAFFIGLIQCLAIIPGTSRSAATIVGAMLLGANRVVAAEFSFFLAIPTMVAASGYALLKYGASMSSHQAAVLGAGFAVSFIVALGVIAGLMKFIQRHNFIPFGIYRIILGGAVLGYFLLLK